MPDEQLSPDSPWSDIHRDLARSQQGSSMKQEAMAAMMVKSHLEATAAQRALAKETGWMVRATWVLVLVTAIIGALTLMRIEPPRDVRGTPTTEKAP